MRSTSGVTIVEAMISLIIIGIGLVGAVTATINTAGYVKSTTHRIVAQGIAQGEIGKLRVLGFTKTESLERESETSIILDAGEAIQEGIEPLIATQRTIVTPIDFNSDGDSDVLRLEIILQWREFGRDMEQKSILIADKEDFQMNTYRRHQYHRHARGFTVVELMLASAILTVGTSLAVSSFILGLRALSTGTDALLLQREADMILNMKMAPQIRVIQNIVEACDDYIVFQYLSPESNYFETNAFILKDGEMYFCQYIPYYEDYPEELDWYFESLDENMWGAEKLGRFVKDMAFSFRDGGNNLAAITDQGHVIDPSSIEIVDIQLTLANNTQVYQVTTSFLPIKQFI